MKKILFVLILLTSFNSILLAQEESIICGSSSTIRVSDTNGYNIWIRILAFNEGYYLLGISKQSNNGYYKINLEDKCFIKTEGDSIISLPTF